MCYHFCVVTVLYSAWTADDSNTAGKHASCPVSTIQSNEQAIKKSADGSPVMADGDDTERSPVKTEQVGVEPLDSHTFDGCKLVHKCIVQTQ